jgi:hypothetical protein
MFIVDLLPLVLGDLCLCRKIIQKYQISSLEAIGAWQGHQGPLGGVARSHLALANVAGLCHLTNPCEWLRNTHPNLLHH